VVAVAVALVVVKGAGIESTAQPSALPSVQGVPPSAAQVPRYYIAADLTTQTVVGDLRTGKVVATIKPPAGHGITGVAGAARGRTAGRGGPFRASATRRPGGMATLSFAMLTRCCSGGGSSRRPA